MDGKEHTITETRTPRSYVSMRKTSGISFKPMSAFLLSLLSFADKMADVDDDDDADDDDGVGVAVAVDTIPRACV